MYCTPGNQESTETLQRWGLLLQKIDGPNQTKLASVEYHRLRECRGRPFVEQGQPPQTMFEGQHDEIDQQPQ